MLTKFRLPGAQRRGDVPDWVFYGPALLLLLMFMIVPIVSSFGFAFTIWDGLTAPRWVGLDNFRQITNDQYLRTAIVNTIRYTVVFVIVDNALAVLIAMALDRVRHGKALWRGIYYFPVLLSGVIIALSWEFILNPVYGPLNYALKQAGLDFLALSWLQKPEIAVWVIIAVGVWQSVGAATVIYLAGLQSIPTELYEAAQIDGASGWQQRRYVTLPLLAPVVTINVVLSLIGALRVFEPVWLLTEGGPVGMTDVIATRVYKAAFLDQRFGYGSALSVILTAASLGAAVIAVRLLSRRETET